MGKLLWLILTPLCAFGYCWIHHVGTWIIWLPFDTCLKCYETQLYCVHCCWFLNNFELTWDNFVGISVDVFLNGVGSVLLNNWAHNWDLNLQFLSSIWPTGYIWNVLHCFHLVVFLSKVLCLGTFEMLSPALFWMCLIKVSYPNLNKICIFKLHLHSVCVGGCLM